MAELQSLILECFRLAQSQSAVGHAQSLDLYNGALSRRDSLDALLRIIDEGDLPPSMLALSTRFLRDWARRHWADLPEDGRGAFFSGLFERIVRPGLHSLAVVFCDAASFSRCDSGSYAPLMLATFDYILPGTPLDQLQSFLTLIRPLSRLFLSHSLDPERWGSALVFDRVMAITFPFYARPELLVSAEGCAVLRLALSIFKGLFVHCRGCAEQLAVPVHFCFDLFRSFLSDSPLSEPRILATALKFVSLLRRHWIIQDSAEPIDALTQMLPAVLARIVATFRDDDYLVSIALTTLDLFRMKISPDPALIDCLLAAAELTAKDVAEFSDNPPLFYHSVYTVSAPSDSSCQPRAISRRLIHVFLLNSVEVARYLLELPPSECLLRCLSITVSSYKEFKMGDDLVRWFSPVFCHPGSPIETAAQMAFTAEIVDDLCPGTGSTIIEHFFPGALRSESLVIQILAAKLLKALIENGDGCCCEPEIVEPLIAFLPVCPTGDAASAIAALVKQSQVTVLPEAQLIIWNLCDIVQTELQVLLSESESLKEEAEDAIDTDLSVMASLVYATGSWLHFDRILILISNFFLLDPQNNEHLYRALGDLLVAMLSSRTPRYEPVVRVIINGLQAHEGALIVCSSFLEPIQGLIGSNREGFLSLGISEMLVEWCAQLLPLSECEDSLFAIGGLIANIAFVDPTVAPMCEPLSDELIKSDKVDIAFIGLEIAAALLVQNRRRPDPMTIERIMKAIGDNWVLTDRHAQLFRLALALAIHHDPPISEAVLPVLAILRDLQASFADADRDDIDVDIPSALLPLQTPIKFTSVYCDPAFETIIHGLAENKPES